MRRGSSFTLALVAWLNVAGDAWAQSTTWPAHAEPMSQGPGFYFSLVKLGLTIALLLLWVRSCDWINRDSQQQRHDYRKWNQIAVYPYLATLILTWLLPFPAAFWIGFPLQFLAWLAPLWIYAAYRNSKLFDEDKVFTAAHIRRWMATTLKPLGVKMAAESERAAGIPLEFLARGAANDRDNAANLLTAKHLPGANAAKEILVDLLERGSNGLMLEYTQDNVAVRYLIDGVWHNGQPRERQSADMALAIYKTLAALKRDERRAKQAGAFGVEWKKTKHVFKLVAQGTKTGERVIMQIDEGARKTKRLPELGMRDKMYEQLKELLDRKNGLVIVSALPGGGLSNLVAATVAAVDRYMYTCVSIEDAVKREPEVDNVAVTTYDSTKGENASTYLQKVIREYPDVIIVADLNDPETAATLVQQAKTDRMVIIGVRAKDSVEAMLRVSMLKIPPAELAHVTVLSLHERLIRKLCDTCKQPYEPSAQVLQQLGLPPGKVEALYNAGQPPPDKPNLICRDCQGLGYRGRTGIFEMLAMSDAVRQLMATEPKLDLLKKAARKGGMRMLQEEGIVLVATGASSVQELSRVLKESGST